jgi:hypothetical protein
MTVRHSIAGTVWQVVWAAVHWPLHHTGGARLWLGSDAPLIQA